MFSLQFSHLCLFRCENSNCILTNRAKTKFDLLIDFVYFLSFLNKSLILKKYDYEKASFKIYLISLFAFALLFFIKYRIHFIYSKREPDKTSHAIF